MNKLMNIFSISLSLLIACINSNQIERNVEIENNYNKAKADSMANLIIPTDSCCQDDIISLSNKESIWMGKEGNIAFNCRKRSNLNIYKMLDEITEFSDSIKIDSSSFRYYKDFDFSSMLFIKKIPKPKSNNIGSYYAVNQTNNKTFIKRYVGKGDNSSMELYLQHSYDFDYFNMIYLGDNTTKKRLKIEGVFIRDKKTKKLYFIRYVKNSENNDNVRYFFSKIALLDNSLLPVGFLNFRYDRLSTYWDLSYKKNSAEAMNIVLTGESQKIRFEITNRTRLADLDSIYCVENKKYLQRLKIDVINQNEPLWRYESF